MKKTLLFLMALIITGYANAQLKLTKKLYDKNLNAEFIKEMPLAGNYIPKANAPVLRNTPPNVAWTPITIGHAVNSYTNAFSPKEPVWYDPNLNTVTFTHRGGGGGIATGNFYVVDKSTDGGATWMADQGPVYDPTGFANGRYPQGVIYNPSGNTDPNNAYLFCTGAALAGTNGANWGGQAQGSWRLDGSSPAISNMSNPFNYYGAAGSAQAFANRDGSFWEASQDLDLVNNVLPGSVSVFKGTWGSGTYLLSSTSLSYPSSDTYGGDADIAFGPDGLTGYVVTVDGITGAAPNVILPYIWKTTDGGNTWNALGYLNLDNLASDFGGTAPITCHPEVDIAVDGNGNLHIATVAALTDANTIWSQTAGSWGVYDLYTTDGGVTWQAQLLASPPMYGGDYGTDNAGGWRQSPGVQISTDWNGNKVFIIWSETDPNLDPNNNYYPDVYVNAWDRATGNWTGAVNVTPGAGNIYYHVMSYYCQGTSGSYELNIVYQGIQDATVSLNPVEFVFLDGVEVTDAQFTNPGNPTGIVLVTGINESSLVATNVSNVYPNPVSDISYMNITLDKPENVTLSIMNITGQTVKEFNLGQLNAGVNKVAISKQDLAAGSYFAQVKSGSSVVTRNFIVK
jgi:hypothetical protein